MLYWVELQTLSGIKELKSIEKTRPIFFIFLGVVPCLILPFGILKAIWISFVLFYNIILSIVVISFIILASILGFRLIRIIKTIYSSTKATHFKDFLNRVSKFISSLTHFFYLLILFLRLLGFCLAPVFFCLWL